MHMDPMLPRLVGLLAAVVAMAMVLRRLHQPAPVVFLLAGVLVGPEVLDLLPQEQSLTQLGELGVLLLLFFLGTEISLPSFLANWHIPVLGTLMQIGLSVGLAAGVGWYLEWTVARVVLLGFVVSLSSTALVLNLLEERKELDSETGKDVLSILLAQDLALAPMLVVIGILGAGHTTISTVAMQLGGGVLLIGLVAWVARAGTIHLPLIPWFRDDPDFQVFGALLLALVLALVSGALGLSTAFGAFVGGLVIGASEEVHWVHKSLEPLRILLVAFFLLAIGAMVDLPFLLENLGVVTVLTLLALTTNTSINLLMLRAHGRAWRDALYGGALLAQIGEFSFVLAAVGLEAATITPYGYQLAISVIAVTLVIGAGWISLVSRAVGRTAASRLESR